MKIVFFGSDDFALAHLTAFIASHHTVVGCVTQPDRPRGRHLITSPTRIAVVAREAGIPVLQPENLTDENFIRALQEYDAQLFVVVAYGKILPPQVLEIPQLFCLNVHGSLLPKYRGAAPMHWAVIDGETKTGITIFALNESADAGDIIAQKEVAILPDDTSASLRKKMTPIAASFLVDTLTAIAKGEYAFTMQDEAQVTRAPKLKKEDGLIDWYRSAAAIHNTVRGMLPWPVAYTYYEDKILKIYETAPAGGDWEGCIPGEVADITKEGLIVQTGNGTLCVRTVHLESSRPMAIARFIAGHHIAQGFRFGRYKNEAVE